MTEDPRPLSGKLWLSAGVIIALGAIATPVLNPDLYWHLSAGKYMAQHLRLPSADFLSWTEKGAPWMDFEWLAQVVYYGIYSLAGKAGLFVLKLALLGATFPLLASLLSRNGLRGSVFFALPLWGLALMPNSDLRPENFSVLFFALLLWRLEAARVSGEPWPAAPAGFASLALFFALWANLHAGFAYGLLLLAFYAAGGLAGGRLWPAGRPPGGWKPFLGAASAFAGSLLNPWGIKLYAVLLEHGSDSAVLSRYLSEWAPPSFANPVHWPFMVFLAVSFSLLLARFLRERRLPLEHLLTLGWLGFEAARHTRHIVFFCMAAVIFSFDAAARLWEPELLRRRGRCIPLAALAYLFLAVWPLYRSFRSSFGEEAAGAAAYLKAHAAELGGRKMYNPWLWGGYLGWALNPAYGVFTDGRYIFHKYLAPVSEAMADQDTWEKFALEKGFDLVLFRRDYQLLPYRQAGGGGTTEIMRPSYLIFMPVEKWALIYWDAFSMLFARRGKPVPGEFRLLRPDDFDSVELALCSGALGKNAAENELERYYKAAAGAPSTREADLFRQWLGGFPASCRR